MSQIKRILAALRLEYSSNRAFLAGMARFVRRQSNWQVTIVENFHDFTQNQLEELSNNTYDGIITVPPHDSEVLFSLCDVKTPIAFIGSLSDTAILRHLNTVLVQGNNQLHGRKVAKHFLSMGSFRSYAFVAPNARVSWVDRRYEGFASELKKHGENVVLIQSPHLDGAPEDINYLSNELQQLQKPAAIMAAYDQRAVHVLQACNTTDLSVPKLVQVIGVDNDLLLCDFSRPALTSLAMNHARLGEIAAIELHHIIEAGSRRAARIVLNDAEIVERDSSSPLSPSSHLVSRALAFIKSNLNSKLLPRDVVTHLKVSRALADKRFRELEGVSIGKAIAQQRLTQVKQKLRTTSHPIRKIARSCGFTNPDHAGRLFKQAFNMTMRDYRKSFMRGKK